jgi:Mrp family chromosome partitioning ATPase
MSSPERPFSQPVTGLADQAVDVQRYFDALRRGGRLIAVIAIVVTLAVVLISYSLPKSYKASASVVYNPTATLLQPADATSTQRQLATFQTLVKTPTVITPAARKLSESPSTLKEAVESSADQNANIITITATARQATLAAARADVVAQGFISAEQTMQTAGFENARAQLKAQVAQLQGTPGSAAQIAALQERISALQINAAGTSSELQIAESASVPKSAASPRPTLNGLIALFAALFVGVLFVLGRDQLKPHFANPRELGHLLRLPVLVGVPYRRRLGTARRRRALSGIEHEAYDVLQASMRLLGSTDGSQRVLLITSATHGEGKTTVAASLGRSLARSGQKVLLVSGDLRSPTLHEHFGLSSAHGLSDCLRAPKRGVGHLDGSREGESDLARVTPATKSGVQPIQEEIESMIRAAPGDLNLDILVAGQTPPDPSSLMSGAELSLVFETIRKLDYDYVLVDSPPILGLGDTQFLARQVDDVLLVARLDRISPDNAEDMNELLRRLELTPMGIVVVGARAEISPYYLSEHRQAARV